MDDLNETIAEFLTTKKGNRDYEHPEQNPAVSVWSVVAPIRMRAFVADAGDWRGRVCRANATHETSGGTGGTPGKDKGGR